MPKAKGPFSKWAYLEVHTYTSIYIKGEGVVEQYRFDEVSWPRQVRRILERARDGLARDERIISVYIVLREPNLNKVLGRKMFKRQLE